MITVVTAAVGMLCIASMSPRAGALPAQCSSRPAQSQHATLFTVSSAR